ncbi:hypothetical protein F3N42_00415 [Marinihelvus fidelis]|uniref:Uncharacterized protein n=1 Tax=Marinihelvus fidelis TaxID=2613842 RepID=A0A5N0TIG8_9GAMM|nr:hypothetical protein F3N42_00415 [Marinihelvus fidelis]
MKPETTKLTIRLPRERVEFAKRFAKQHGVTVTEVIGRYFEYLQAETPDEIHPDLEWLVGIIPPDVDVDELRYEYLKEKYGL